MSRIDSWEAARTEEQEAAHIEERQQAALACLAADCIQKRQEVARIEKLQVAGRNQAAVHIEKRQVGARKRVSVRIQKHQEAAGFGTRRATTCSRSRRKAVG